MTSPTGLNSIDLLISPGPGPEKESELSLPPGILVPVPLSVGAALSVWEVSDGMDVVVGVVVVSMQSTTRRASAYCCSSRVHPDRQVVYRVRSLVLVQRHSMLRL